jgi:dolichol-phosphate mannosyltransferase
MKLSIIVPCYNEAENVARLQEEFYPAIQGLLRSQQSEPAVAKSVEVVFVDDGSRDGTFDLLNQVFSGRQEEGLSFQFERHAANRGLGAALRTGFAAASGEVILTTDSDGTYRYSEIPNLLSTLMPEIDIVTASPYHRKGGVAGVPAYRLILSRGSSFLYRILVDWNIYTYTALFRAYRRRVIDDVTFQSDGFLAGTELLVKGILKGYKVAEYPAVLYRRQYGVSKARLLRTILAHLRFQGWILINRIRPGASQLSRKKI